MLDRILLYHRLGDGSDVIVEEEVVCAGCLREGIY
jgi:hypothetical protein